MKRLWLIPLLFSSLAHGQMLVASTVGGSFATAATPTFSPVAGAVANPTTVTASSTSGCSTHIYEDTSNPPTTLQNTFSVTTAETVYAQVRGCPGFGDSAVGSAAYTITTPTPSITTTQQCAIYNGTATCAMNTTTGQVLAAFTSTNAAGTPGITPTGCVTWTQSGSTDAHGNSWFTGPVVSGS